MHQNAHDIAVRPEHFVFVQEELDVETFKAVRQITLALDVFLELQNEELFELAFPRRERRRGRPPDSARLGSSVCFAPQNKTSLPATVSLSYNPVEKHSGPLRALPPLNCICVGPPHSMYRFLCALCKKQNDT